MRERRSDEREGAESDQPPNPAEKRHTASPSHEGPDLVVQRVQQLGLDLCEGVDDALGPRATTDFTRSGWP